MFDGSVGVFSLVECGVRFDGDGFRAYGSR